MSSKKSDRLPEAVQVLIPKKHKVLAWAQHPGGYIVATNQALISTDTHDSQLIPWGNTVAARWDEPLLTLVVQRELDQQPEKLAWMLTEPGQVPSAVHDRVMDANLVDLSNEVAGVGKVRFIARKGAHGVTWTTVLENGSNVSNADTGLNHSQSAAIEQALSELRSTLGI